MDDATEPDIETAVTEGIELGEATKKRLASDPDAVRKIVAGQIANTIRDTVTVYPDKVINLEFAHYAERLRQAAKDIPNKFHNETDEDYVERTKPFKEELDTLEAEGEEIRRKVRDSGVTFEFVGLGKKAIKRIRAEVRKEFPLPAQGEQDDPETAEERQDAFEHRVIAAHLAQSGYTADDIASFHDVWPNKAYADLWATAMRLSIADDYLSGAIDADF